MNYRHAFHAGNFADLVKHAALLQLLARLTSAGGPLTVIDTHAGRGLYDLASADARRSGEAEAGVVRLMAASDPPTAFAALTDAVGMLNPSGEIRRYPGSPWLIAQALRPVDRYVACELRPEEHAALRDALRGRANIRTLCADGYEAALAELPAAGRALLLIDPPFERPDDYRRIVETLVAAHARNPGVTALVWLPIKDLETFDGFLRDLEDRLDRPALVAEARMRPLTDPMRMNGCALVLVGAPPEISEPLAVICEWTVCTLGDKGLAQVRQI